MKELANVLCAVDIADAGRAAFAQALALAETHRARLHLVHDVPQGHLSDARLAARVDHLRDLSIAATSAGIDVTVSVDAGDSAEVILRQARDHHYDLVVVSSQHGTVHGRAVGAVAEAVLRSAPCPTLVVPADPASPPVRSFTGALCAVDRANDLEPLLARVHTLVGHPERGMLLFHVVDRATAGPVLALHAIQERETGRDALRELQDAIPLAHRQDIVARVAIGEVVPEILRTAQRSAADVIIVKAQRRSAIGRWMFGVTRELLKKTDRAVLAVPAHAIDIGHALALRRAA